MEQYNQSINFRWIKADKYATSTLSKHPFQRLNDG